MDLARNSLAPAAARPASAVSTLRYLANSRSAAEQMTALARSLPTDRND